MASGPTVGHKLPVNGLVFNALSESRTCRLIMRDKGAPDLFFPNRLVLHPALETTLAQNAQSFWYPQPEAPLPAEPAWVLNTCADADTFLTALLGLDMAYPAGPAIFNHPRAVMTARRDIAGVVLSGIKGLEVPKCRRFVAEGPRSYLECFEQGGFQYPVSVQSSGAHAGAKRLWILQEGDWHSALPAGEGGRRQVMVQGDPQDPYAGWPLRMAFVGGSVTVSLVGRSDGQDMPDEIVSASQPLVQSVLHAAQRRIPLDYWVLDVALLSPNHLRLLDISVGVHIPDDNDISPRMRQLCLNMARDLAPQVASLVAQPQSWRSDARNLPSVAALVKRYGA